VTCCFSAKVNCAFIACEKQSRKYQNETLFQTNKTQKNDVFFHIFLSE